MADIKKKYDKPGAEVIEDENQMGENSDEAMSEGQMKEAYAEQIQMLKERQAIAERDGSILTETRAGMAVPGYHGDDRLNDDHDLMDYGTRRTSMNFG